MIYPKLIIPTVLIPFTLVSVLLSAIASFIAALFGFQLKLEGPRRLLEALLKPRVLIAALALNLAGYGSYKAWIYLSHLPSPNFKITWKNRKLKQPSNRKYPDAFESEASFSISKSILHTEIEPSIVWSKTLSGGSFSGPVNSGQSLFIGTEAGLVEELDLLSGSRIRSFFVGTPVTSTPIIFSNFLFVGEGDHYTHHARIYKFDLSKGEYVGSFSTKGHTEGQLTIGQWQGRTLLFVPSGQDGMHAVDPTTMKQVWHRTEGHSDATARFSNGLVFWGTGKEKAQEASSRAWAVAVNFNDGAVKWKHELPASSWMQPLVVDTNVCFTVGEIYYASEIGGTFCFDRESGTPTSTFYSTNPVVSQPVLFNQDMLVTEFNGRICRLSMKSNRPVWCTETDGSKYSLAPVTYDSVENVFVYSSHKKGIYVLDPETGRIVNNWMPENASDWKATYAPIAIGGGLWITTDMKGNIRSLRPQSKKKI